MAHVFQSTNVSYFPYCSLSISHSSEFFKHCIAYYCPAIGTEIDTDLKLMFNGSITCIVHVNTGRLGGLFLVRKLSDNF